VYRHVAQTFVIATMGIHVPTWDSAEADSLWTSTCGSKRWRGDSPAEQDIRRLTDLQLWQMQNAERRTMIDRVRKRYARQLASEGGNPSDRHRL
jgi:glycogen phosphorylase